MPDRDWVPEEKVLAPKALHEKLRTRLAGESFGDMVGRWRPG